jgi:hypothetical protein
MQVLFCWLLAALRGAELLDGTRMAWSLILEPAFLLACLLAALLAAGPAVLLLLLPPALLIQQ